jgi:hypothetical protein
MPLFGATTRKWNLDDLTVAPYACDARERAIIAATCADIINPTCSRAEIY